MTAGTADSDAAAERMLSVTEPVETDSDHKPGPMRRIWAIGEARVGLIFLLVILAVVLLGPLVAPYPPTKIGTGPPLSPPSSAHWLGTDQLGRDVLSRILCGGGSVLVIPALATVLSLILGGAFGMTAGYVGGRTDAVFARLLDVLLAVPPLLTVLVMIAGFGTGNVVLVVGLVLVYAPRMARVLRGAVQNVRSREFVDAAQLRGERVWWILVREIVPNMWGTISVEVAIRFTYAIIFVSVLNFLGLGQQPPSPNWGLMVSEGRTFITTNPILAIAPSVAIAVLVVSIHLLADAFARAFGADSDQVGAP